MAQFNNQPALLEEGRSDWLRASLDRAASMLQSVDTLVASDSDDFWMDEREDCWYRPYRVKDGILHVPVKGVLLNNFPYAIGEWATGYEYILAAVVRGMGDPAVKGIAFVLDSGGGMVSGNFDLVDRLYAMRGQKPMRAYAAEFAYSAAYSIASAADTITVARTGGVGSIGVVTVHTEYSKMLEKAGITTTVSRSKSDKMEANSVEPLSEGALARIQERVDAFDKQFVAIVARNRNMAEDAVHATNGRTFMATQAVENGLADEIGNFDDALTAFVATINLEGDDTMADFTQAQVDEAVASAVAEAKVAAKAEGMSEGTAAGATAERARITAILTSEEGQKRPKAAIQLATDDDFLSLKPEAVSKMLANMAVEDGSKPKAEGRKALSDQMKGDAGNKVDGDDGGSEEAANPYAKQIAAALGPNFNKKKG